MLIKQTSDSKAFYGLFAQAHLSAFWCFKVSLRQTGSFSFIKLVYWQDLPLVCRIYTVHQQPVLHLQVVEVCRGTWNYCKRPTMLLAWLWATVCSLTIYELIIITILEHIVISVLSMNTGEKEL